MGSTDTTELETNISVAARISKEVLMSFRLLFGQTRRSRGQAKLILKELREQDQFFDQLLETVCAKSRQEADDLLLPSFWPNPCLSMDGKHLQEEDSYSSQEDFPIFGQRLARLQAFTLKQQPSRIQDLWRDRRNPLQWYTFWAVLIVGGLSVLLALFQLAVGVAQLVVAIKMGS